jgi:hypothetical protein
MSLLPTVDLFITGVYHLRIRSEIHSARTMQTKNKPKNIKVKIKYDEKILKDSKQPWLDPVLKAVHLLDSHKLGPVTISLDRPPRNIMELVLEARRLGPKKALKIKLENDKVEKERFVKMVLEEDKKVSNDIKFVTDRARKVCASLRKKKIEFPGATDAYGTVNRKVYDILRAENGKKKLERKLAG